MNVARGKKYYISKTAFWGDTSIEKVHAGKTPVTVEGLPNLKRIKADKKDSRYDTFYWNCVAHYPSLRRVDPPESVRYIYKDEMYSVHLDRDEILASIQHVYLYSQKPERRGTVRDSGRNGFPCKK